MSLDSPSRLFFKQGFGLTEKVQYEIGRGSYVFGALYCSGADVYAAIWRGSVRCKVAQTNIQAILPKFIVNPTRQARQKRCFAKGMNCDELLDR